MAVLTSCGLTPIHGNNSTYNHKLSSIAINTPHSRQGQLFSQTLSDLIDNNTSTNTLYRLEVSLDTDEVGLAIQSDRTVTRFRTIITANYKLIDTANQSIIRQGSLKRENGYDKTDSEYATYIAKQQAIENTITALARDFRPLLASAVAQ